MIFFLFIRTIHLRVIFLERKIKFHNLLLFISRVKRILSNIQIIYIYIYFTRTIQASNSASDLHLYVGKKIHIVPIINREQCIPYKSQRGEGVEKNVSIETRCPNAKPSCFMNMFCERLSVANLYHRFAILLWRCLRILSPEVHVSCLRVACM